MTHISFRVAIAISFFIHLMAMAYALHHKAVPQDTIHQPLPLDVYLLEPSASLLAVKQSVTTAQDFTPQNIPVIKQVQSQSATSSHSHLQQENVPRPSLEKVAQSSTQTLNEENLTNAESADVLPSPLSAAQPATTSSTLVSKSIDIKSIEIQKNIEITNTAQVKTGVSISASYAKNNQKPEYPAKSRRFNEQGTVVLMVLVLEDGTAGKVDIKNTSGFPLLDESAKIAVLKWHFIPSKIDGRPINEFYTLSIPFTLTL